MLLGTLSCQAHQTLPYSMNNKVLGCCKSGITGAEHNTFAAANELTDWTINGRFSVSIAYECSRPKGVKAISAKTIWNAYVTPKHAFIAWLAINSKLFTKDRLQFLQIDCRCSLCTLTCETTAHLFFECSFSQLIWGEISAWVGLRRSMFTLQSAMKWIKKESGGTTSHSKAKCVALVTTIYHIWTTKNRLIFENLRSHDDSIIRQIKTFDRIGCSFFVRECPV